jgi:phage terminase Nu1 subunit (DNA packaging protein)
VTNKAEPIPDIRKANKAQAAEFFGVSLPTVDAWIRKGAPVRTEGARGVSWELDLHALAQWRYGAGLEAQVQDPDRMPPAERKAWYEAEKTKRNLDIDARLLVPRAELEHAVSVAFAAVTQDLLAIPDQLERLHGVPADVAAKVDEAVCAAVENLRAKMARLGPVPEGAS